MIKLTCLENQIWVERALPPLAKRHDIDKEEAWSILETNMNKVAGLINNQDSELHMMVKNWLKYNRANLEKFGLGIFRTHKVKASDVNYSQLICIVWLDRKLKDEAKRKEIALVYKIKRWLKRWWDRIKSFFRG